MGNMTKGKKSEIYYSYVTLVSEEVKVKSYFCKTNLIPSFRLLSVGCNLTQHLAPYKIIHYLDPKTVFFLNLMPQTPPVNLVLFSLIMSFLCNATVILTGIAPHCFL